MKGDVFCNGLFDAWTACNSDNEPDHVPLQPVLSEFQPRHRALSTVDQTARSTPANL